MITGDKPDKVLSTSHSRGVDTVAESPEDKNARLFHFTTLSPRARATISNEMYFIDTDKDSVDDESVQQEAFMCLTEDLSEIGVYWATSNEDIYANTFTLDQTLSVLDYIMPNTLYVKMRDRAPLVQCLRSLVQGDISDTDPLIAYINFLGGDDERAAYDSTLSNACQFVKENIRSTEVFLDYITSLLSKYDDERTSKTLQLTSPKEYHIFVMEMTNRHYDASVKLKASSVIDDVQQDKLNKRIALTQRYFLQSDNIESFSFVTLTDVNDLASDGQAIYDQYKKAMFAGCRMTLEYRTIRDLPITLLDAYASLVFLYGITVSKKDYLAAVQSENALLGDVSTAEAVTAITSLYSKDVL